MRRAYNALTLDEERHAILGIAHLALAGMCRREHLKHAKDQATEYEKARKVVSSLEQELDQNLREEASEEVWSDKTAMLAAMQVCGHLFGSCSAELRNDSEVVLAAARHYPPALEDAGNDVLQDRSTMLEAVARNGWCLAHANAELQNDLEVVKAAVGSCPRALEYASPVAKGDREVVLTAVRKEAAETAAGSHLWTSVLARAAVELQQDRDLLLEAVRTWSGVLSLAGPDLKGDKDLMLQAMRRAPSRQKLLCYEQFQPSEQLSLTFGEVEGAADSALAAAGDAAPVLNVASRAGASGTDFDVSLLSGATFAVSSGPAEGAEDQQEGVGLSVGELAQLVLAELPEHGKTDQPPERLFLVFSKHGGDGESSAATPWDWSRPVSDFL